MHSRLINCFNFENKVWAFSKRAQPVRWLILHEVLLNKTQMQKLTKTTLKCNWQWKLFFYIGPNWMPYTVCSALWCYHLSDDSSRLLSSRYSPCVMIQTAARKHQLKVEKTSPRRFKTTGPECNLHWSKAMFVKQNVKVNVNEVVLSAVQLSLFMTKLKLQLFT